MGITIALLAYKEEENLKVLLPQIIEYIKKVDTEYEIIVVDTEQPLDHTEAICNAYNVRYVNQRYMGFGGAFRTAIEEANYEYFLIMDSDGSHNPIYIPEIYRMYMTEKADVVIGSRYVKGGKTCDSFSSIVMSKILNTVFRICLGIKAHDISTDYRMYNTDQLKKVVLENKNYDVLQEVLLKMKLNKPDLKIKEIPITFTKRMFGESKRKLIPFIISYIKSLFKLTCIRFPSLKNFFWYGLIGGLGAVIDYGVFSVSILQNIVPEFANVFGGLCGFAFTFIMNTYFNFNKRTEIFRRLISYGTVCLCGMLFSTACIYLFTEYMNNIYLLKLVLLVVVSLLQFFFNKKVTYKI